MCKANTLAKWALSLSAAGVLAIALLVGCSSQGGSAEKDTTPIGEATDGTAKKDEQSEEEGGPIWVLIEAKTISSDGEGGEDIYTVTNELDEAGNTISLTDSDGNVSSYLVDQDGWPIEMASGDVTMTNEVEKDESGRAISMKSEGSATEYTYNNEGNIVESNTTSEVFSTDEDGNRIENSEFTIKRQIIYGDDGFVLSSIVDYGDRKTVAEYGYEYGGDGLPISSTVSIHNFDADNNEMEGSPSTFTRTFGYDEHGNLTKVIMEDEYDTTTYEYSYVEVAHPSVATRVNEHLRQL